MATSADFFQEIAAKYDSFSLRAMPRYQEMIDELMRVLPGDVEDILELGCGTGSMTSRLAIAYPTARITAVDAAPAMLDIARKRLSEVAPDTAVEFVVSLFEDLEPEHGYDLVTSSMSLHHVADKASLYAKLHDALRPGGLFAIGDELTGALPHVTQLNWDGWLEFARNAGLSEDEIADTVRHEREFDHYETLPNQINLLRGAGFNSVDCVWRYRIYGVFVARA